MLRRTQRRSISQFNFGQPSFTRAFGPIPRERQAAKPGSLQSTKLPNGVRVVSHDLDGPHTAVGVYVDAGPKYDPLGCPGMSHVMRYAIQTSNMDSSLFQVDRTMRASGNAYGHSEIRKHYLAWKSEGRRDMWEKPFEMIATGVVAPRFHESDIERFRDTMDNQREEQRWQHPRAYCVDALETVAFFKEPLGAPRVVPPEANDRCSTSALVAHWAAHFAPNRVTVAGVNVPHDALLAAYAALPFPHAADAPHHARCVTPPNHGAAEAAQFHAGRERIESEDRAKVMGTKPDMEAEVIAAIGGITYGFEEALGRYATALVLREVYQSALERHALGAENSVRCFYRPYASAGLLGVTLRGAPSEVPTMLQTTATCFPAKPTKEDVEGGRARAAVAFIGNHLEMVRDYCDFIATSSATPAQVTEAIAKVSVADLEEALRLLNAAAPAVYVTGNTFTFPKITSFRKM